MANFKERIMTAKAEAQRFLERCEAWEKAQGTYTTGSGYVFDQSTPKENGALRRASMDLTRALADMRK